MRADHHERLRSRRSPFEWNLTALRSSGSFVFGWANRNRNWSADGFWKIGKRWRHKENLNYQIAFDDPGFWPSIHSMPDVFTAAERSKVMASVRSRGNRSTELALLSALKEHKITGWRRHYPVTGKPDFAFPHLRLAVFVDGCFWHGCPRCGRIPHSNRSFWETKINRNKERDRKKTKELKARGWSVLRVWEHDLRHARISKVIRRIQAQLSIRQLGG